MQDLCELSPFNLKKDLKSISEEELCSICEEIGNELIYGVNHPPTVALLYRGDSQKTSCVKIRTMDIKRNKGKSSGYRCIALVDAKMNSAFLLHLYRHGHGEDKNISKSEMNQLKKLVDEYTESMGY